VEAQNNHSEFFVRLDAYEQRIQFQARQIEQLEQVQRALQATNDALVLRCIELESELAAVLPQPLK
jgi:hypothetical protein